MSALHTTVPTEVLKQVRSIEISTRKLVNQIFSGQYSSVFKGRGMEFSQVREYQPGDEPKLIDWNVSARTGHLFTKEFMEERELTVMLLIDASRSLFFGSRKNLKSEIAAELTALLAFSAIRNNDKVGMIIFTDQVEKFLPPRKGQRNILRMIREILGFQPKGNSTNLAKAMEFLGHVIKRRAVCFLMSDFLSPLHYEKALRIISKKHDLIAVRIRDRLEQTFPLCGRFLIRDLETHKIQTIQIHGLKEQKKLQEHWAALSKNWEQIFQKNRVDMIEITTGEPYIAQLLSFFKKRAKRFR
jgi:uncharacterized protein (DUF58 family)